MNMGYIVKKVKARTVKAAVNKVKRKLSKNMMVADARRIFKRDGTKTPYVQILIRKKKK